MVDMSVLELITTVNRSDSHHICLLVTTLSPHTWLSSLKGVDCSPVSTATQRLSHSSRRSGVKVCPIKPAICKVSHTPWSLMFSPSYCRLCQSARGQSWLHCPWGLEPSQLVSAVCSQAVCTIVLKCIHSLRQLSSVEIKITFELEVMHTWSLTLGHIWSVVDIQCLWLRTRICLLKCLHKTLSCLNTEEPFQTTEQKPPLESLHDQILELGGTVGSMDQHIGMMLLMQRSKQQLVCVVCLSFIQ